MRIVLGFGFLGVLLALTPAGDGRAVEERSQAGTPGNLASYTETIPGTAVSFDMIAIPGGSFAMGSPDSEPGRKDDEGPEHKVTLNPFWIGKTEITWDEYEQYYFRPA